MTDTTLPPPGRQRPRPMVLAFIFSLVPGAGHMYLGLMDRGIQLMLIFFGTLFLSSPGLGEGLLSNLWAMVVAPVTWFYSFFDALQTAGRLNQGEDVADRPIVAWDVVRAREGLWGWALIALGVVALLDSLGLGQPFISDWLRRLTAPLAISGLGLWLLFREKGVSSGGTDEDRPDDAGR